MHEENVIGIQVEIEGLPPWCKVVDVAGHPIALWEGGPDTSELVGWDGDGHGIVDIGCARFNFYEAIAAISSEPIRAFDPMEAYGPSKPLFYRVAVVAPDLAASGEIPFVESERWDSHALDVGGIGDRVSHPLRRITVPCVGIDAVLGARAKVLKMDCEGAEFGILEWLFDQPRALADQITVEIHPLLLAPDERDARVAGLIHRAKRLYWQGVIRNNDTHLLFVAKDIQDR